MNVVQYTVCRSCGKPIVWANKPDGRRNRPLELVTRQHIFTIGDDGVVKAMEKVYVAHICPEDYSDGEG